MATGGAGGASAGTCPPPYVEPAMATCGMTCSRCAGGDATIEKILALTPPDGKMKVGQDYHLDSEKDDPDSTPVVVSSSIYKLSGAIYWVADMDIDCDGRESPGKCDKAHDCCFQPETAFLGNASAAETPYVVIPNNFKAVAYSPGAVVAIVYGGKVGYAVLGDTGPPGIIGEASYAAAEMMGIPPSAVDGGINGRSVTYILFTGAGTAPSKLTDRPRPRPWVRR
jgi:hypothetical protein